MDGYILGQLLHDRLGPGKFLMRGEEVWWQVKPSDDDLAAVDDIINNYDSLAATHELHLAKQQAMTAIQNILDAKAKDLGFDSIHTAAAWLTSKNPARAARAQALLDWGDKVWDFAENEWSLQGTGQPTFVDVESFLASLPTFGI